MDESLIVQNDGPRIVRTNYFDLEPARKYGRVFVSVNAGAFRLLVPDLVRPALDEMATGKLVVVSRGPWPEMDIDDAVEVLFDDGTAEPFALHLEAGVFDRLFLKEESGRSDLRMLVYARGVGDVPALVLDLPARYRVVPEIPWMKPWGE